MHREKQDDLLRRCLEHSSLNFFLFFWVFLGFSCRFDYESQGDFALESPYRLNDLVFSSYRDNHLESRASVRELVIKGESQDSIEGVDLYFEGFDDQNRRDNPDDQQHEFAEKPELRGWSEKFIFGRKSRDFALEGDVFLSSLSRSFLLHAPSITWDAQMEIFSSHADDWVHIETKNLGAQGQGFVYDMRAEVFRFSHSFEGVYYNEEINPFYIERLDSEQFVLRPRLEEDSDVLRPSQGEIR